MRLHSAGRQTLQPPLSNYQIPHESNEYIPGQFEYEDDMGGGGKEEEEEEEEEEEIPDGYLPKASALTFRTCTPGFCLLNNNQFSAI